MLSFHGLVEQGDKSRAGVDEMAFFFLFESIEVVDANQQFVDDLLMILQEIVSVLVHNGHVSSDERQFKVVVFVFYQKKVEVKR